MTVLHHALLGLSVAALAGAGLRLASLTGARGLERVLAAAVLAAAAAALEALVLGLAGWGTSTAALALAAGGTWQATRFLIQAPEPRPATEVVAWWRGLELPARLLLGAAAGVWLAWAVWLLRWPALGYDSVAYHVPEVVAWVHGGRPGAVETILPSLPVGNYPLTNEVLLAWGSGIARSFVVIGLWAPAAMLQLALASVVGLRALRVPFAVRALAVAALSVTPVVTHFQMNGAYTDLPALAWLVSAGALVAASLRRPLLLAPALVAAGLAVGTKTTVLPLTFVVIGAALWVHRNRLRQLAAPLALAAAAALAVGGYWYLRNLIDHGSPFWPIVSGPWGDRIPDIVGQVDSRFIQHPRATLRHVGDDYADLFAGGVGLLACAIAAPLLARRRAVAAAAAATAASVLLWMSTPLSGVAGPPGLDIVAVSSLRYLLAALASAVLTLGLTAREEGAARLFAMGALAAATVIGAWQTLDLGFPSVPSPAVPLAGAILGAAAGLLLLRIAGHVPPLAAPLGALALGALLAVPAHGFVARHADTDLFDAEVTEWAADRPEFSDGDGPIAMSPRSLGLLAGDRLQHRLDFVPRHEPCRAVTARLRDGWVVQQLPRRRGFAITTCLEGRRPLLDGRAYRVFGAQGAH